MKIYVVTSGIYSSYHIEAIFSTRKEAELYVAAHEATSDDDYYSMDSYIEEYEMDNNKVITNKHVYYHYRYIPQTNEIMAVIPTFNCKESYVKINNYGHSKIEFFNYWSINGKLSKRVLIDEYNKWKAEQVEKGEN